MSFQIPKAQQKVFVEHFMKQVLDLSLQMLAEGKAQGSPGETIHRVGQAVIQQLYSMGQQDDESGEGPHDA